jgi:hypothetical protein
MPSCPHHPDAEHHPDAAHEDREQSDENAHLDFCLLPCRCGVVAQVGDDLIRYG